MAYPFDLIPGDKRLVSRLGRALDRLMKATPDLDDKAEQMFSSAASALANYKVYLNTDDPRVMRDQKTFIIREMNRMRKNRDDIMAYLARAASSGARQSQSTAVKLIRELNDIYHQVASRFKARRDDV